MFNISIFRNEEIANIQYENNAVVLQLDSTSKNGNRTVKVLSFAGVPDTKPETIVKHLLKSLLAEFRVSDNFNSKYFWFETGVVTKDSLGQEFKEMVKSGIRAKRYFTPFLNSNTIFKTDSSGKLSHSIECDTGILLKDTALNIKEEQLITLFGYNSKQFRSALHNTAKAILEQCSFVSLIKKENEEIENGLLEVAKMEQEELRKKQEQEQKQKKQKQETETKTKTA